MIEPVAPGDFIKNGYVVTPAERGGFVLRQIGFEDLGMRQRLAAFSNSDDLVAYLTKEHAALDGKPAPRKRITRRRRG